MPIYEEEFDQETIVRVTVVVEDRRLRVELPRRERRYTIEEILVEARLDCTRYEVRRDGYVVRHTEFVEHGHILELTQVTEFSEDRFGEDRYIEVTVVSITGERHPVRLLRREHSYTVREVLIESRLTEWERCEVRCHGVRVSLTELVEHGHIIELSEVREEFHCTVVHRGRRFGVRLPFRARAYTVEEVLREADVDYRGHEIRCHERTVRVTDIVEHGHVLELTQVRDEVREEVRGGMFREEVREEFRCTVVHRGQRFGVRLPYRRSYTVEEVLREAQVDCRGYHIRRNETTIRVTDIVEHGHVIELIEIKERVYDDEPIRITVVAFGRPRQEVRLPRRDRCYTVEDVLYEAGLTNWERCELRRNGYTVTTTEVVEHGHVIYVLTKIKGN